MPPRRDPYSAMPYSYGDVVASERRPLSLPAAPPKRRKTRSLLDALRDFWKDMQSKEEWERFTAEMEPWGESLATAMPIGTAARVTKTAAATKRVQAMWKKMVDSAVKAKLLSKSEAKALLASAKKAGKAPKVPSTPKPSPGRPSGKKPPASVPAPEPPSLGAVEQAAALSKVGEGQPLSKGASKVGKWAKRGVSTAFGTWMLADIAKEFGFNPYEKLRLSLGGSPRPEMPPENLMGQEQESQTELLLRKAMGVEGEARRLGAVQGQLNRMYDPRLQALWEEKMRTGIGVRPRPPEKQDVMSIVAPRTPEDEATNVLMEAAYQRLQGGG